MDIPSILDLARTPAGHLLFRPWFDQRLAARYTAELALDTETINAEVLACLESWRTWHLAWRAVLADPVPQPDPALRLVARASDEFFGDGECAELPEPMLPRTRRILALIDE